MYEYRTMTGRGLPGTKQLNLLSEEGWELVQIVPFTDGMVDIKEGEVGIYFRRVVKAS